MSTAKHHVLFYSSLFFAIWFACAGVLWSYWAALFIAYPFGLLSFFLWRSLQKKELRKRNKLIPVILILGLICSLTVLGFLLLKG